MGSGTVKRLADLAVGLGLGLLQAGAAAGSAFKVTPIQVTLSGSRASALVTVTNESEDGLRLQVSSFAWTQSPKGEIQLAPTKEVVYFPSLVEIGPGKEAKVRIGAMVPAGSTERTYRVFFEELAPVARAEGEAAGSRVRVLTKMGLPVFLEPLETRWSGAVENAAVTAGTLRFVVHNTGNVHFTLLGVKVSGASAAGAPVLARQVEGWYVLPGGVREYEVPISAAECVDLKTIELEARTDKGGLQARLEVPAGVCAPPAAK